MRRNTLCRNKSAAAITSLLLLSLVALQVSSVCFDPNDEPIEGCVCHESCATCGRTSNPAYDADCISCADGSAVKPQYSDFTGLCGKEKSDQVACLDEQFSLKQCNLGQRLQGECTNCELELDNVGTDFCLPLQRQICSFGECCSACEMFAFAYSSCLAGLPQENEFLFVKSPDRSCTFEQCNSMSPVPVPSASPITTAPTEFPSLSPMEVEESQSPSGVVIVGILGIILFLVVALFLILRMRRGKKSKPRNQQSSTPVDPPGLAPLQVFSTDTENPADSQDLHGYRFSGLSFKDQARSVVGEVVASPDEQESVELPPFAMVTPVLPPIDENTEQEILYAPVSPEHTHDLAGLVDAHVARNRSRLPRRVTKISVDL